MNGMKLLGHPLHPAVVHFPVSAWTAVLVTDALSLRLRDPLWGRISEWLLVIGAVTALGAMTAGFMDLIALPPGQPAQQKALRHMYVMTTAWTVYVIDLLARLVRLPGWAGLVLSAAGFFTLLAGTHLGAQLVYDFGVGQTGRRPSP